MQRQTWVDQRAYRQWEYQQHLLSPAWLAVAGRLAGKARGKRCACCGLRRKLQTHHWHYPPRSREHTWWLVKLCEHCHKARVHRLSLALFGKRTKGLWFTTVVVTIWGKVGQRCGWGRRHWRISAVQTRPGAGRASRS